MSVRRRRNLALVCLIGGLALTVPFDATATLVAGLLLLGAFIVLGVFAVADPEFLAADRDDER